MMGSRPPNRSTIGEFLLAQSSALAIVPTPQTSKAITSNDTASPFAPRIAIITALPKESAAVRHVFGEGYDLPLLLGGAVRFHSLPVSVSKGRKRQTEDVILCQCIQMGNNSAAVAAAALLLNYPTIEDIIMVGIAGGIPVTDWQGGKCPDHVRKGDVVIGTEVYQYDMLKIEVDNHINRARPIAPSALLLGAVQQIEQERLLDKDPFTKALAKSPPERWRRPKKDILQKFQSLEDGSLSKIAIKHPTQDRKAGFPIVHSGKIGSANILVKDHVRRDQLRKSHKICAVEMEGSGVADAAWHFGVGYLVVRGICDYCDMDKDDTWQMNAAYVAAVYAKIVIERTILSRWVSI